MKYFISIDCGTTNTRIFLICDEKIIACQKVSVGAGDTSRTGSNIYLKAKIKDGICSLLDKFDINKSQIECAIASGMITSELGLLEIPHAVAPIGVEDIAVNVVKKHITEVCPFPIYFVAGVKNFSQNNAAQDMIRGEETEALGILSTMADIKDMLLVLPGSHLKILVITNKKIESCRTSLLGEASKAISQNTILKDSFFFSTEIDPLALEDGYQTAKENGITTSLFNVRKLGWFLERSNTYLSNYFDGVMMYDDVRQILKMAEQMRLPIVIGGSSPVKDKLSHLIENKGKKKVTILDDDVTDQATAMGAIIIHKKMGGIL